MTTEYQVRLDAFEGPLDLLLFLIRRAEVEVTDIPIAVIADQFIESLRDIDTIDIDTAGEFLVMAATLTEIKARMLAPPVAAKADPDNPDQPQAAQAAIDPRAELVRQLLEYKRYRDAAHALLQRRDRWEAMYPAAKAHPDAAAIRAIVEQQADEAATDIEDVTLADLVDAFSKILVSVDFTRVGEHHVLVDETPIELHAEDILEHLRREPEGGLVGVAAGRGEVPFASIFAGRTRTELIGLFLAMLELVRQRRIQVRQDRVHAQITLSLREPDLAEAGAEPATHAG
ncbi:MAG: segregation/condensation protein A [Phycisphaeraceae bacterium]|nr:segregation/condensation protein A [Phycisphaeraceae bacterium]